MAAHHYRHPDSHHCHHPTTTTSSSTVCCCCYITYSPSHFPPVPDSYLPHYHQVHHPTPQTHFCNPNPNGPTLHPNPPYTSQSVHSHHHQQTQFHSSLSELEKERYFHNNQQPGELAHDHPIVSSLLRRIAALESSIRNHSASRSHSLRDAAARTIQSHFRAFLVRRSRTLRQLKDLASVKSTLNILKSSVSENTHFDPQSLFHKASRLQFKLGSIQGDDPMIRDGKKSISRELTRLLDFIDGFRDKSSVISTRLVKRNVISGDHERGTVRCRDLGKNKGLEDLVSRVDALFDKIPEQDDEEDEIFESAAIPTIERSLYSPTDVQAKAKKSVRFVENGKVYKASRNGYLPVSNGDSVNGDGSDLLVGAKGQLEDKYTRKAEEVWGISSKVTEDDEEDQSCDGKSTKSSDSEGDHTNNLRSGDGSLAYSAPLPVKMDSRTDTRDKRKTQK